MIVAEGMILPEEDINARIKYEEEKEKIDKIKITLGETFEKIKEVISYYLDIPEKHKTIIALWIIGTYIHKSFETFPYLFFNAMRGSGKSRALKLITALSYNGQVLASLTEAVLFRTEGTLAIDEFESLGSKDKQALRELLNACYKQGLKIMRMKKKKVLGQEEQVVEEFEPYRPIIMANIWGIEEVLGDRCLTIILEKSNNSVFTKLVEDFRDSKQICSIKLALSQIQCSLCSVVTPQNIYMHWNNYIKDKYLPTLTTLHTYTTLTTQTTQERLLLDLFGKIDGVDIDGRNLELYLPLFFISGFINDETLNETIEIAKEVVTQRKNQEVNESKDVLMYRIVSNQRESEFISTKDLLTSFRLFVEEGEMDWLNSKWIGRALKRLNLVVQDRRIGSGMQYMLNIKKAKEQLTIFEK